MSGGRVLVTGATGRLGRAVLIALNGRGVAGVRRRGEMPDAILIGSDGTVNPIALREISAVINCAGRVEGTVGEIEQANVTYPTTLARAARMAGVTHFVQVSSFSIFGRAERIGLETPLAPIDNYGRSKAAAERALTALNGEGFRTLSLRLPFMFSAAHPALLGRLVTVMRRLRVLPTPVGRPSRRSMITYGGAADALTTLADAASPSLNPSYAADPRPLELLTIAQEIWAALGQRIVALPVPEPLITLSGMVAPGLANRLFRSSTLDDEANLLHDSGRYGIEFEMRAYLNTLHADRRLDTIV